MKTLIVDDIEDNLYLLETILKGSGYEVVTAKDGVEALTKLKEESVDLIISDILMPRMDGFQLCRECKKEHNLKKIPFIFYTATYIDKKDVDFALSLGADRFIVKPTEPKAFLKILNEVIDEYKRGVLIAPKEPMEEKEEIFFERYNKRLIHKLEQKMFDLEKANKILQEKEEKIYRLNQFQENIIYNANVWINVLDEKGNVALWNEAAEKMSGYSATEVIGHDKIWQWLYPDENYRKEITEKVNAIIEKGEVVEDFETRIVCKDGQVKFISWHSRNLKNPQGSIIGSVALGRDVTERKQAVEAIQQSENRFRELFNNMSSGVGIYEAKDDGKNFIIKDFNRAGMKIEKIKKGDIIGKNVLEVFPGLKDFGLFKVIQEVYHTSKPQFHPASFYQDQRISGWRENYVYKLPSGEIVSVYDDITERKTAEEKLKDSEEYLKILFDYAPDAYYISDLKGNFVDGNLAAEKLTGYKREELIGESFLKLKLLSLVDIPKAIGLLAKNLRELPTGPDEFVLISKDKKEITVEISTYPVKIKGRILVLGIARDVTEQKKTIEKIKELAKYPAENPNPVLRISKDGTLLYYNHPSELLLKQWNYRGGKLRQNRWLKPVLNALRDDDIKTVETDIEDKTIFLTFVPIVKNGFVNVYGLDITKLKKTETALAESEERYRTVFENTGTATAIIEEDMTISMINKQAEKLIGYSKEEIENKMKWTDFVFQEDLERMKKYHIARRKGEGNPLTEYEFRMMDKKGNIKDIFLKIGMIPSTKKSVASLTDITERKQKEERIKHLNLILRAIRNVNQLIVTEKDREKLLKGACDSLIKTRGYYRSRIVLLDEEGKMDSYAEDNLTEDFLSMIPLLKKGKLPTCLQKALKQESILIIEDTASTCTDCPLSQGGSSNQGAMTIRLEHSGKIYGVMSVSIPVNFIADQEEHDLFKEVAGDIALGLSNIEMREKLYKQTYDLKKKVKELKRAMDATIETISKILEAKDPYTAGHQQRVSQLATAIAKELNLSEDKVEGIRIASLIHDIGKIGLPTEILSKPAKLAGIEFNLIKEHPQIGYNVLKSIEFYYPVASIILQHHERLNGSGYPHHLKGNKIFLEACILGVADVVEAMSSHRPYRPALGIDAALEEIIQNKGILYDPEVVDACLMLFKEKEFKFE